MTVRKRQKPTARRRTRPVKLVPFDAARYLKSDAAIAEYLNETMPDAGMLPADRAARAHCRSV